MLSKDPNAWYLGWMQTARTATLDVGAFSHQLSATKGEFSEPPRQLTLPEVKLLQERARREGIEQLFLAGHEPTSRRDLGAIIRSGTKRGLSVGLRTDGRRFMVPGYAQKMADCGLRYAEVVLFGPKAIHETILANGSFEQTSAGIDALLAVGVEVVLRCPVRSDNIDHLPFFSEFAEARPGCAIVFLLENERIDMQIIQETVAEAMSRGTRATIWTRDAKKEELPVVESLEKRPIRRSSEQATHSLRGVPILANAGVFRPPEMGRLDKSPRYPDTALITLIVAGCDLNCIFCETPQGDVLPTVSSLSSVQRALESMREGASGVYFTGGEPSSVPGPSQPSATKRFWRACFAGAVAVSPSKPSQRSHQ